MVHEVPMYERKIRVYRGVEFLAQTQDDGSKKKKISVKTRKRTRRCRGRNSIRPV